MSSIENSSKSDGLLDTNVLIHALMSDSHTDECEAFLSMIESGQRSARLETYIVHEMTYALSRQLNLSKHEIVAILLRIIQWPGIECDRQLLSGSLVRWRDRPALSFIDALLATQASLSQTRVFTKNIKDFADAGIEVPQPLANYTP